MQGRFLGRGEYGEEALVVVPGLWRQVCERRDGALRVLVEILPGVWTRVRTLERSRMWSSMRIVWLEGCAVGDVALPLPVHEGVQSFGVGAVADVAWAEGQRRIPRSKDLPVSWLVAGPLEKGALGRDQLAGVCAAQRWHCSERGRKVTGTRSCGSWQEA